MSLPRAKKITPKLLKTGHQLPNSEISALKYPHGTLFQFCRSLRLSLQGGVSETCSQWVQTRIYTSMPSRPIVTKAIGHISEWDQSSRPCIGMQRRCGLHTPAEHCHGRRSSRKLSSLMRSCDITRLGTGSYLGDTAILQWMPEGTAAAHLRLDAPLQCLCAMPINKCKLDVDSCFSRGFACYIAHPGLLRADSDHDAPNALSMEVFANRGVSAHKDILKGIVDWNRHS